MRYSNDTFLVNWCPAYKGPLKPFSADNLEGIAIDADQISSAINSISAGRGKHSISVSFTPPFPEITGLDDRTTLQGQFVIKANKEEAGRISGTYLVIREGDEVQVKMHPLGGWESKPGTLFLKFLFRAVSIFCNWPKTYFWTAAIKLRPGEPPLMESRWNRIK